LLNKQQNIFQGTFPQVREVPTTPLFFCGWPLYCAGHINFLLIAVVRLKLLVVQNYGVLALIQGSHLQSESNFHSSKVHRYKSAVIY